MEDEKIKALIEHVEAELQDIYTTDILHEEVLGAANSFEEADKMREELCGTLLPDLPIVLKYRKNINPVVLEETINIINSHIASLKNIIKEIDEATNKGVHRQEFPSEKTQLTKKFRNIYKDILKAFQPLKTEIRIQDLLENIDTETITQKTNEIVSSIESAKDKAEKAVRNLEDNVAKNVVGSSGSEFSNLKCQHQSKEGNWFTSFCIFSFLTVTAVCYVVFFSLDKYDSNTHLFLFVLRNLLIISTPLAFLKISLNKYNIERNLGIIYSNRETVLNQFSLFEAAIGDDEASRDAKNRFRMEVAKYIFSDPQSGYINSAKSNDVNVNPVINIAEEFIKKS